MEESWLKVHKFETYSVSNFGRIRNDISGKMLKLSISRGRYLKQKKQPYLVCTLTNNSGSKNKRIQRLVAEAFIGDINGKHVDHIDHDTLNNVVSNLRIVSVQQNNLNRRVFKKKKVKYKGVSIQDGKFRANIYNGGKQIYKFFDTAEDAARWYDENAVKIVSPFISTNASLGLL